jgi:hypothetical protein
MGMTESFDRTLYLGTDIASFYLFHPDDLAHRATSPLGWETCGFACRKEFEAGRLVGWSTGSDGGYGFRLTDGELTQREVTYRGCSWDFRLGVQHNRVMLDNGDCIPNAEYPRNPPDGDDRRWIALSDGDYRVTVTAIEWDSEPGAIDDAGQVSENALTNYVIQFNRIADIAFLPVPSSAPPRLECSREFVPIAEHGWPDANAYLADQSPITTERVVVLENRDWLLVPGFSRSLPVADRVHDAAFGDVESQTNSERIDTFVLVPPGAKPGEPGVLVRASGASRSGDDPWQIGFMALRLVRTIDLRRSAGWSRAQIKSITRPTESIGSEALESLKSLFTTFAQTNQSFRSQVPTADFVAEQVMAMTSPESLTHALLHHLTLSPEQRLASLLASDADRVRTLTAILTEQTAQS